MAKDDLRLLFETERRIFKRRMKTIFPSGSPLAPPAQPAGTDLASRRLAKPRGAGSQGIATTSSHFRARRRIAARISALHWVASILVHLSVVAALWPLLMQPQATAEPPRELVVRWIELPRAKVPAAEAIPEPTEPVPATLEPEPPLAPVQRDTPEPLPIELASTEPAASSATAAAESPPETAIGLTGPPSGSGASSPLGSRTVGKAAALVRTGGNAATEQAVAAGLGWLAAHQDPDGSWGPDGFRERCPPGRPCHGGGFPEYRVGVTGLALLAFLGAGITGDPQHPHHDCLMRGLAYLQGVQDAEGCFGARQGNYMYNHGLALFCLAEAALLTRDPAAVRAVERGLEFAARAQQPGGGWDYTTARTLRNDLSITGWIVMALHTARQAGIEQAPEMETSARRFVERAVHRNGWSTYADRGIGQDRGGVSIAAVGMLTKLYLGWSPRAPELARTVDILVRRPPEDAARLDWDRTFQSSYYWYYATLALFHHGGEAWEAWNVLLQRTVLPLQQDRHHLVGSWDPDPNWIGAAGGRVATTALVVLTFEVYYRYTPLWQQLRLPPHASPGPR